MKFNVKDNSSFIEIKNSTILLSFVLALLSTYFQNVMPLSAGQFKSEKKNMVAQCPPRLHVQFLTPVLWSRVPNHFLKVTLLHIFCCFVLQGFRCHMVVKEI